MNTLTVGHDSEFAVTKGGKILSALEVIKPFESKDGRYFPDNLNCEIAINPVTTLNGFHAKTEGLLNHIRDQGFELLMEPVIKYPDEALEHPMALISGCNPDYSAYTMFENESPDFAGMDGTRSAGAHVHVGADGLDPYSVARWMDLYLGLPLMMKEIPNSRRSLYGGAGCLRVKPYGVEYRTLSNVWVDDAALREFVWEGTMKSVEAAKKADLSSIEDWNQIPAAIDTHDVKSAKAIIDRLYLFGVKEC